MGKHKNEEIYNMVLMSLQGAKRIKEPRPTKEEIKKNTEFVEKEISKFKNKQNEANASTPKQNNSNDQ